MRFKRVQDQLNHINRSYIFLPSTYTSTKDVDLNWDDLVKFYNLIYSIVALLEHVVAKFLDLLRFLDSWVVYRKKKGVPLVGLYHSPPSC
jgi:hypothetical protein